MKKVLLKSFFALIALVCAFSWSVNANAKVGDFNGDGNVNVGDVSSLYQAIVSGSTDLLYDINGDGYVNAGDVSKLYDIIINGGPEEFAQVFILGNTTGDWDPTQGQEMTTTDGKIYTAQLEAVNIDGYSYFGFTTALATQTGDDGWAEIADKRFGAVSEGDFLVTDDMLGVEITLTNEGYQAFQIPTGTYNLTLDLEAMTLVIEKEVVEITDLWMIGDFLEGGWAPNNGQQLTYDAENKVFTTSLNVDAVKYFSFTTKLADDADDWDGIAAYRIGAVTEDGTDFWVLEELLGQELALQAGQTAFRVEPGQYTITVDLNKMNIIIDGEITPPAATDVWILGDFGEQDWASNAGLQMTYDETNQVYTAQMSGNEDMYFSFTTKLAETAEDWDAIAGDRFGAQSEGDFWVTPELLGTELTLTKDNYQAFKLPAGTYTLTLDLDKMNLIIDGEMTPETPADVWVLGKFGEQDWAPNAGLQMTYDETTQKYTAQIAGNEDIYFSFTTKLAETAEDWDAIAGDRFGAVSDGDFVVTAEMLNQELSLTKDNYQAFKAPAGEYTLTLDLANLSLVIDGEIAPEPIADVWVLGKFGEQDWAPNAGLQMTYDETTQKYTAQIAGNEDIYFSFTTKLAETAEDWDAIAGDRFGAVSDGDFWVTSEILGTEVTLTKDNYQAFKAPAGEYTLTLDLANMSLVIDGEIAPEPIADVWVLGKFGEQDWAPNAGLQMTYDETTQKYTAQIAGNEDIYFSFTTKLAETAEDWDAIAGDRFGAVSEGDFVVTAEMLNQELSLTKDNYQAFKAPAGEYTLTLDLANMSLVIDGEIAPEPIADLYLFDNLNDWDLTAGTKMTYDETTKKYTGSIEADKDFYFVLGKAQADAADGWDAINRISPQSNGDFWVTSETLNAPIALMDGGNNAFYAKAGAYTVTVDLENMEAVITGEIAPEPIADLYLFDNLNDWDLTAGTKMTYDETSKKYTGSIEADKEFYFVLGKAQADAADGWDAINRISPQSNGDFWVTSETLNAPIALMDGGNNAFYAKAGAYTVTVDLENMEAVITGEIAPEPVTIDDVWILGEPAGGWATNNGLKMTYDEVSKVYTASFEAESDCYFSFTTKLAETADDWDGIASYRFGAVSDGDFVVTAEQLGTTLSLTKDNYHAFKVPAGSYELTLDLENMGLVINGEMTPVQPSEGFYLVGTCNDWSDTDKTYALTQSATDANVYSIQVPVSGDFWFKIAPAAAYDSGDFWNAGLIGAPTDGMFAETGTYVVNGQAWCLPGSWNATTLTISINTSDQTWTFVTDGEEPVVSTDYDYLYIAGTMNSWTGSTDGAKVASVKDEKNFSGVFDAGSSGQFKFQKDAGSWATNWGGSNGQLASGGSNIAASGMVYVTANLNNMSYGVTTITSIGIIGDATPGGWDSDTQLTYNNATGAWEGVVTLTAGTIKFRANNGWDINWGGALNNLVENGENITVTAGTYKVSLKLVCKGEYVATLTLQ